MNKQEGLNVYFYAFYDTADKHAYSGLVADTCKANVIGDIMGNFQAPVYVTVRKVPELIGLENGSTVEIVTRPHRREIKA